MVMYFYQCCVSSANPKLSNGSIPSNPNQQQSASSKAKKVSTVDRYSVSKPWGEDSSDDEGDAAMVGLAGRRSEDNKGLRYS